MAASPSREVVLYGPTGNRLYPSPREATGKYFSRGRLPRDIKVAVSPTDWAEHVELSAKLCSRIPSLRGAVRQKSEWAFAGDSWQPIYYGPHEAWGDIASDWLINSVFPNAVRGNVRKDLIKAMQVSGMGWDIHGDDLALFRLGANNMPQVQVIPGTRIGNGPDSKGSAVSGWTETVSGGSYSVGGYTLNGMGVCVGGPYDGYRIYNGVIYDDSDEPIAVRVLGYRREGNKMVPSFEDFALGFANGAHLASEYEWHEMGRPLPRIAASVLQWMNKEQIDANFLKGIDLASKQTVIHKLNEGEDALQARGDALQIIETTDSAGNPQKLYVEVMEAGDVKYISSGESLDGLNYQNPHPNVEEFARRILAECLTDLGWPYELTDLSSTGRAPTRLSCELVNNSLWQKQVAGETRLQWFVRWAIGVGIKYKHIPEPPAGPMEAPYLWTFGYPKEMSVDQGNDVTASLNRLRYGLTSQRVESARWGHVLKRIRRDRQKEVFNLIEDASNAVKYAKNRHGQELPFLKALEFFYQPSANPASLPSGNQGADGETKSDAAPTQQQNQTKPAQKGEGAA